MQRETRMKKELGMLQNDPPPGISCWMVDDRIDHLHANIIGGTDTPYYGGIFKLDIIIPERYPFQPPKVQFLTPIYHPNIDNAGRICLDILKMPPKGGWKPSWNVSTVLKSVQSLMVEPNPDDPLMADISDQFKYRRQEFDKTAKQWTKKHAVSNMGITATEHQVQKQLDVDDLTRSSSNVGDKTVLAEKTNSEKTVSVSKYKRQVKDEESDLPTKIVKRQ